MVGDDDWLAVVGNFGEARNILGLLSWILIREGGGSEIVGTFLQSRVAGSVDVRDVDMCAYSLDGAGPDSFQYRVA